MKLNNENEIRLWSLTFASVAGNPEVVDRELATDAADFAVRKLRTRLGERRGVALVVANREALKLRAKQVAQEMKPPSLHVPSMKELAWTQVAEAALGVVAGDISDELSLDQEEEIVRYIRTFIIPWLKRQALSECSTTVEETTK